MSRTERLLALMQQLRTGRRPRQAHELAQMLGVSLRTLYRDIDLLRAQGADIRGEAGVGYVLKKGAPTLPPLMFAEGEIEALVLGLRWVVQQPDPALAASARSVLAKVEAVLPARLVPMMEDQALYPVRGRVSGEPSASVPDAASASDTALAPDAASASAAASVPSSAPSSVPASASTPAPDSVPASASAPASVPVPACAPVSVAASVSCAIPVPVPAAPASATVADTSPAPCGNVRSPARTAWESHEEIILPLIRQALRENRQLQMDYADAQGQDTRRTIWPVALGYLQSTRLLAAWCTLRADFRHFRTDRIRHAWLGDPCPRPRRQLEAAWLQATGIRLDQFHDRD
jgi:hypothetical protein